MSSVTSQEKFGLDLIVESIELPSTLLSQWAVLTKPIGKETQEAIHDEYLRAKNVFPYEERGWNQGKED